MEGELALSPSPGGGCGQRKGDGYYLGGTY